MSLITNWRRILAKIVCNSAECVPCGPWESIIICQSTESSTKHNMYCFIIWTAEQSVKRTGPWYSDIDDPQRIQTLYHCTGSVAYRPIFPQNGTHSLEQIVDTVYGLAGTRQSSKQYFIPENASSISWDCTVLYEWNIDFRCE